MTRSVIGRWGKNLAVRVPMDVARATGLSDGEAVEIEVENDDLVIRRRSAHVRARRDAEAAAAEIAADRTGHRLEGATIRELLDEGRRG